MIKPFAQQHFDVTVIAGALQNLGLAQLIDAAVADMRPIGRGVLHQAQRAGRARPRFDAQALPELHDFFVRAAQGQMQESQRIENRMRRLPERLEQRGQRSLGGARAFRMSAHAVDHHQQHGVVGGRHRDPVLIFLAVTDEADVRGLDLQ